VKAATSDLPARERTSIFADLDVEELVENMSRNEPEAPSIAVPLAHEAALRKAAEAEATALARATEFGLQRAPEEQALDLER
jgi:hypothetical protein